MYFFFKMLDLEFEVEDMWVDFELEDIEELSDLDEMKDIVKKIVL